jgi:outer membrane protein
MFAKKSSNKMKKLSLLAMLSFFSIASAQTEKGTFLINGTTNLNFVSNTLKAKSSNETYNILKTKTLDLSPGASYFVLDNFAIGLNLGIKRNVNDESKKLIHDLNFTFNNDLAYLVDSKSIETTFTAIPNATYFFSKGKIKPFVNAGLGYSRTQFEKNTLFENLQEKLFSIEKIKTKSNGLIWEASGGVLFLISPSIGFDVSLGYANYSYKNQGVKYISSAFGANAGINIFLPQKKK